MNTPTEVLGKKVLRTWRIEEGRNSRVYVLECEGGQKYVAKHYFASGKGGRDNLGAEFHGSRFLWEHGERAIPRPVLAVPENGLTVFDFVEGAKLNTAEANQVDIDQAVCFLLRLKALSQQVGAMELPVAAEACFSISAIAENLETRLNRLLSLKQSEDPHAGLSEFLSKSFVPALAEIVASCKAFLDQKSIPFSSELAPEFRTLSPSDFGFHNAIRRPDGHIVFLDLEYFGWDDPAKMISDFILHPAMELTQEVKHRFFAAMVAGLASDPLLEDRVRTVCPLYALKWCLILLNEFIPQNMARRTFAGDSRTDLTEILDKQLAKAQKMLETAREYHVKFPF